MTSFHIAVARVNYIASVGLLCTGLSAAAAIAQDQPAAADNSANNKHHAMTADQQAMNPSDREITQKIRKAVVADKSLSMYAHNVKIIASNGAVTLKGPVKSEDEKQKVASLAADIVGGPDKVTDNITVKQ